MKKENISLPEVDLHDKITQAYYGELGEQLMRQTQKRIHWICSHVEGDDVLDVGCSQGIVPILLGREGKRVLGIDISKKAIEFANAALEKEEEDVREHVVFERGNFLKYDFTEKKFDTIIIAEVLEHLLNPEKFIEKSFSLLQGNGKLIVTVPFGINDFIDHKQTYYLTQIIDIVEKHFIVSKVEILGKWLGVVAKYTKKNKTDARKNYSRYLVEKIEKAFYDVERGLTDKIDSLQKNLSESREKYRHSTAEIKRLKGELAGQEVQYAQLLIEKDAQIAEVERQKDALIKKLERELNETGSEAATLREKIDSANDKYRQSMAEIKRLKGELAGREAQYAQLQKEKDVQIVEMERQKDALIKKLNETESETARLREKIDSANDEYRHSTAEIKRLKEEMEGWEAQHEQLLNKNDALTKDIEKVNKRYRFAMEQLNTYRYQEKELSEMKNRLEHSEQTFRACRMSASYRLGHLLIHETKSIFDFFLLPKKVYRIWKDEKKTIVHNQLADCKRNIENAEVETNRIDERNKPTKGDESEIINSILSKTLKVAVIMDEFTFESYRNEANVLQLTPQNWEKELFGFSPDLLFVESAWRGKDDLWGNRVGHKSSEVVGIIEHCKQRDIPTVFWNKEDPVHFETFINTASLFDFVFTTDIDCIGRYKSILGHDRVYLLPFACQPAFSNPIEKYERKDAFCFAGAYYVRYPERTRDLNNLVMALSEKFDLDIYDRNYDKNDPNYAFPKAYKPFIVGSLPFSQIEKAYKGYRYAINLNSIKQSQTMFARRVYELLASNTLTVSNFSRGVRLMFGDLIVCSDNGEEIVSRIEALEADERRAAAVRLAALRKVMKEHTYRERFLYLCSKVWNTDIIDTTPKVLVVGRVNDEKSAQRIRESYEMQVHSNKALLLLEGEENLKSEMLDNVDYVAFMTSSDYYGKHYLVDLVLATRYVKQKVITKHIFDISDKKSKFSMGDTKEYSIVPSASIRASLIASDAFTIDQYDALSRTVETAVVTEETFVIDSFNYLKNAGSLLTEEQKKSILDADIDAGVSMHKIYEKAEKIVPLEYKNKYESRMIGAREFATLLKIDVNPKIKISVTEGKMQVQSMLDEKEHTYVYGAKSLPVQELFNEKPALFLETTTGLNVSVVLFFFSADQSRRIGSLVLNANKNHEFTLPDGAEYVQFGLRIYGSGSCDIGTLYLEKKVFEHSCILAKSRYLVLTNHYPSYDDLYRNGFVHSRVKAYREKGLNVDVFRLRKEQALFYDEFQGIDVITGDQNALDTLLSSKQHKSVLIHFLDPLMWEVVKKYSDSMRIVVWLHGAEIQPWWRRKYNYDTEEELERAKKESEARQSFWKELIENIPKNLHFVIVSQYFANEIMEDLGMEIPRSHYSIIHNPIDTELFSYVEKPVEQRKKILSIRPYASAKYANDLSVKAVQMLSEKDFFKELEFRFIGDGKLFDKTLEPLKKYENVIIEKCFLTQSEIAALHKAYGVFLTPTRMDAQGVSRDEAMSSGLVPVTNAVAAIPEFVDESCGILAGEENAKEMVKGIEKLYKNPTLFKDMSKNAFKRVKNQSEKNSIIEKEILLFKDKRVLILGSCVSRDAFNFSNNFTLVDYFARTSFASLFGTVCRCNRVVNNIESSFQKRIVKYDMNKTFKEIYLTIDYDILLVDFIDERFDLLLMNDGGICTLSNESISSKILEECEGYRIIRNNSDEFMHLWKKGWIEFVENMKKNSLLEKIRLNKVFWAKKTERGEGFLPTYSAEKIIEMNQLLEKMYAIAELTLPKECVISYPSEVIKAADQHRWGVSPFHYIDEFYEQTLLNLWKVKA